MMNPLHPGAFREQQILIGLLMLAVRFLERKMLNHNPRWGRPVSK